MHAYYHAGARARLERQALSRAWAACGGVRRRANGALVAPRALQSGTEIAQIGKRDDARRDSALDMAFRELLRRAATARERTEFTVFSSEGTACRAWQVAPYQGCERHRIKWLRQYALGAKRDVALDLAALHAGGQEQNRNVGSSRVLA